MLLIVTNRGDHTADYLISELHRRRARFARFNTEDYPARARLRWSADSDALLEFSAERVDLASVTCVWYRRPIAPTLDAALDDDRRRWAIGEAREALEGVWRTLDARWVNHPDRNRVAAAKPAQLRAAMALGLTIPASLITNDAAEARAFIADQPHGAVVKPLSHGRLEFGYDTQLFLTSCVDADDDDAWKDFGAEPYLFQALIPKRADVRVTVIGDEAFAVRIHSQAHPQTRLDYRAVSPLRLRHEPTPLPADVRDACVQLVADGACRFGAIDLIEQPSGQHVFLENNPNGQWAWLEQRCSVPLRARLADLLLA